MTAKQHYHLVTGSVIYQEAEDQPFQSITLNGIVRDDAKEIPTRLLGRAQQILQVNFMKKIGTTENKVVDVILLNFAYLGEMTEEEFQAPPAGTKLQEKSANASH